MLSTLWVHREIHPTLLVLVPAGLQGLICRNEKLRLEASVAEPLRNLNDQNLEEGQ
jgi:hypothetical protein